MQNGRNLYLFFAVICFVFEFIAGNSYAVTPKSELIQKNGFKRDKKDRDPEIHLKNGIVLEAQSNGHLEAEQGGKDLGEQFFILPNGQGTHDIYVIGKKRLILIMNNVFARRDKGDGDWEILLSRKWDLWLEIDSNCESKEFLLGELETGSGKDIDLKKIFGL